MYSIAARNVGAAYVNCEVPRHARQLCFTVEANAGNRPAGKGKLGMGTGARTNKRERAVTEKVALDTEVRQHVSNLCFDFFVEGY
jgi:hypothetical protein